MFAYRLALEMGQTDVDAMLAGMTAGQLREWAAYYSLDPWGQERADWRNALSCLLTYSANRGKRSPQKSLSDFMPKFGSRRPGRRMTDDQMKSHLMGIAASMGIRKAEEANG